MNSAALLLSTDILYCSFVNDKKGIFGLYIGKNTESWQKAAELSAKIHIQYLDKPVKKVISILPEMYDELWTGAKGMYKLEPVVADGGELIIYAPHIQEISFTHGRSIKKTGYHIRDYFLANWEKYKEFPLSVLAHSTHLKGQGFMENGEEKARIHVRLATGIPPEVCKQINLEYLDPESLDLQQIRKNHSDEILIVENAGEILYRLK
jgi:nickel-dependent lactate racemase